MGEHSSALSPNSEPSPDVLVRTLEQMGLFDGDIAVVELRSLKVPGRGTVSGYFDNALSLAREAAKLSADPAVQAVYVTLNPVEPECLHKAPNCIRDHAQAGSTTSDRDIECRRMLLVDFDPKRPSGISSTDAEHAAALLQARACRDALRRADWPEPLLCDSGNGAHLLYQIELPNDDDSKDLVRQVLLALASQFDTETVDVDKKVFNAARITKLYGTLTRKGEATPERPHRRSAILEGPDGLRTVPVHLLRALASSLPQQSKVQQDSLVRLAASLPPQPGLELGTRRPTGLSADLESIQDDRLVLAFFERHGVSALRPSGTEGWYKGKLDHPSHTGGSGTAGFGVSPRLKAWHDFRNERNGGLTAFLVTYQGMSKSEAGREVARFFGLDDQSFLARLMPPSSNSDGRESSMSANIPREVEFLDEPEWQADLPEPTYDHWLVDGETGEQIGEQAIGSSTTAYVPPRPAFERELEHRAFPDAEIFYAAADEIRDAPEVVLSIASPTEIGVRAILDRVKGSGVPQNHGSLQTVKAALAQQHVVYADSQLRMYLPNRGFWKECLLADVEKNIQAYDGAPYGKPRKDGDFSKKTLGNGEVQSALKCGLRHVSRPNFFQRANVAPGLALRNSFCTVEGGRIVGIPHNPWHRARWGYDVDLPEFLLSPDTLEYQAFAERSPLDPWWQSICPVWQWLISTCLPEQHDDVRFLQELVIASLTGQATQYQKGAILLGEGGNGKGAVLKAIQELFPPGTVSTTNPGTWKEVYDRTPLIGKLLNLLTESSAWKHMDSLKAVMTGDPIEARLMGMNAFTYEPIAGHIFSCNRLPPNVDDALLSRWEVIEFKHKFRGSDSQVSEGKIIADIRRELPGFLLWAIHGWFRLAATGRMTIPERSKALKTGWREDGDTALLFLSRVCRKNPDLCVLRTGLYEAYQRWCSASGFGPQRIHDANQFKKIVNREGYLDGRKGKNRYRVYLGLELLPETEREL